MKFPFVTTQLLNNIKLVDATQLIEQYEELLGIDDEMLRQKSFIL